jgi:hypothetical protein
MHTRLTELLKVHDVGVGLGLDKVTLAEPHVDLDGKEVSLQRLNLRQSGTEGLVQLMPLKNFCIETWMVCTSSRTEEGCEGGRQVKDHVMVPGGKGCDWRGHIDDRLSIDIKDPWVLIKWLAVVS